MLAYTFYEADGRVMRYAEALAKRGDEVDVIALKKKGQPANEVVRGVNVFRVQERVVNEKGKLTYLSRLLKFFIKSSAVVTRRHFESSYDLVHVHSVPDFEIFAAWFPKLTGSKVILDIHDIVPEFYASKFNSGKKTLLYRLLLLMERACSAFADHVIISNHIWRKKLVARSVPESKCTVIINYPDTSVFYRRPRLLKNESFRIIYPGTLNEHQGLDIAIKAFALISDKAPGAEFHIYGKGSEKDSLMALAKGLGLNGKIVFRDLVPIEKIAGIMADSDLGVVPKRCNSFGNEAFSTKIMEFMALGVPVVVSSTDIDRYYFSDTLVKFFKSNDVRDLADTMLLMIRDRDLRDRLVKNSYDFIKDNNWAVKKYEYLRLIDRLADTETPQEIKL